MNIIHVGHSLFLSKVQRLLLASGQEIYIQGFGVPVWTTENVTSEPATEVFTNYILNTGTVYINTRAENYTITLSPEQIHLLNLSDWLTITGTEIANRDGEIFSIIHQVIIGDISILEDSMFLVN